MVEKLHKPSWFWDGKKERKQAKKQHRTTVLIDDDSAPNDDWEFVIDNKLKPTELLRMKIREIKESQQLSKTGQIKTDYYNSLIKEWQERMNRMIQAMNGVLTEEQVEKLIRYSFNPEE